MALRSRSFSGDPKLEAAAVNDSAHIVPGTRGSHVGKIQSALNLLDGAGLTVDDIYGSGTAAAVLAFKTKRNIVNRAYQTSPDNIVGKLTMAALDEAMVVNELQSAKSPRIVAVHPAKEAVITGKPLPDFRPLKLVDASRFGEKAKTERSPQIIFPGRPFQGMELKVGAFGTFDVLDGQGAKVRCWDEEFGLVMDPAEPSAHGGSMPVKNNPHHFQVLARKVGSSFIEVKKPGASLVGSDLISLTVVNDSIRATWNPTWSPKVTNPMSCIAFQSEAFGPPGVLGMGLFGPKFEVKAKVEPDASIDRSQFELGIIQTLIDSSMTAFYLDANEMPLWRLVITEKSLPIRDSEKDSPVWAKITAVKELSGPKGTEIEFEDRPRNVVPWQTKDKKGTLVRTAGEDVFGTWLAARHKATDKLTLISWATWSIDWNATFDFKIEKGTPIGLGKITGDGNDGAGPKTPVLGGPIANKSVVLNWTGPAGGF